MIYMSMLSKAWVPLRLWYRLFTHVTEVLLASKTSVGAVAITSLPASKGVVYYLKETARMVSRVPSKCMLGVVNWSEILLSN
jgi:hypothetical protein